MEAIEDRPYTVAEVAKLSGVNRETVYRWIERGEVATLDLPGATIRIPAGEVRRLLTPKTTVDLTE